jgi:hypothetical protein
MRPRQTAARGRSASPGAQSWPHGAWEAGPDAGRYKQHLENTATAAGVEPQPHLQSQSHHDTMARSPGTAIEGFLIAAAAFLLAMTLASEWMRVHVLPIGAVVIAAYVISRVAPFDDAPHRAPTDRDVLVASGVHVAVLLAWIAHGALVSDAMLEPALGWIASGVLVLAAVISFVPAVHIVGVWVLFAAALALPRLPHIGLGVGGLVMRLASYTAVSLALTAFRSGDAVLRRVVRTAPMLFAEHALISVVAGAGVVAYVVAAAARESARSDDFRPGDAAAAAEWGLPQPQPQSQMQTTPGAAQMRVQEAGAPLRGGDGGAATFTPQSVDVSKFRASIDAILNGGAPPPAWK